ncbi:girdin-like [Culex pipiens pallens]|uniref:girdin-like n=1 Tax=Culex pipiens pallens TaxID=42434 RepID=UPI0019548BF1|nr:girdin-like [Culex pipiens pallens]
MSTGQLSGHVSTAAVNPPPEVEPQHQQALASGGPVRSIDELYRSIQQEIQFYKREHEAIRADLSQLIQSNRVECTLGELLAGRDGDGEGVEDDEGGGKDQEYFKRISNEVINSLRNQLEIVWEEKNTLESLWKSSQKTIQILELEIGEYRRQLKQPKSLQDLRQHYTAALELLQQNLLALRTKLVQRTEENKRLQASGAADQDRLRTLERDFSALQTENQQLQSTVEEFRSKESKLTTDLETTMKEKAELEALLDQANALARKHMARENQALAKVQEALQIADTAIDEKNTLVVREKNVREECNFLASTIGQVMEEAAHKVELEMNSLRMGYEGRIAGLEKQLEQAREALEQQAQKTRQAEGRAATLEDKFKALIVTNQNLDADLHAASKLIIEMELKLEAFQKTMAKEREISKTSQVREHELKQLLATAEQLKDRWKSEMVTLTDGLQRKLAALRRENCMLKAENNQLKDQLLSVADPAVAEHQNRNRDLQQ